MDRNRFRKPLNCYFKWNAPKRTDDISMDSKNTRLFRRAPGKMCLSRLCEHLQISDCVYLDTREKQYKNREKINWAINIMKCQIHDQLKKWCGHDRTADDGTVTAGRRN